MSIYMTIFQSWLGVSTSYTLRLARPSLVPQYLAAPRHTVIMLTGCAWLYVASLIKQCQWTASPWPLKKRYYTRWHDLHFLTAWHIASLSGYLVLGHLQVKPGLCMFCMQLYKLLLLSESKFIINAVLYSTSVHSLHTCMYAMHVCHACMQTQGVEL